MASEIATPYRNQDEMDNSVSKERVLFDPMVGYFRADPSAPLHSLFSSKLRWRGDLELARFAFQHQQQQQRVQVNMLMTEQRRRHRSPSPVSTVPSTSNNNVAAEDPSLMDYEAIDVYWRRDIELEKNGGGNAAVPHYNLHNVNEDAGGEQQQFEHDLQVLTEKSLFAPLNWEEQRRYENLSKSHYVDFYRSFDTSRQQQRGSLSPNAQPYLDDPLDDRLFGVNEAVKKGQPPYPKFDDGIATISTGKLAPNENTAFDLGIVRDDGTNWNDREEAHGKSPEDYFCRLGKEEHNIPSTSTSTQRFSDYFPIGLNGTDNVYTNIEPNTSIRMALQDEDSNDSLSELNPSIGLLPVIDYMNVNIDFDADILSTFPLPSSPTEAVHQTVIVSDEVNEEEVNGLLSEYFDFAALNDNATTDNERASPSSGIGSSMTGSPMPTSPFDERPSTSTASSSNPAYRTHNKLIPKTSEYSTATSSHEIDAPRKRGRRSKDEQLVCENGLPASAEQITKMNHKQIQCLLKDRNLSDEQRVLIKKIRRRGRNKAAARKCRQQRRGPSMSSSYVDGHQEQLQTIDEATTFQPELDIQFGDEELGGAWQMRF